MYERVTQEDAQAMCLTYWAYYLLHADVFALALRQSELSPTLENARFLAFFFYPTNRLQQKSMVHSILQKFQIVKQEKYFWIEFYQEDLR
jgi:hypothetical protein